MKRRPYERPCQHGSVAAFTTRPVFTTEVNTGCAVNKGLRVKHVDTFEGVVFSVGCACIECVFGTCTHGDICGDILSAPQRMREWVDGTYLGDVLPKWMDNVRPGVFRCDVELWLDGDYEYDHELKFVNIRSLVVFDKGSNG